MPTHRKADSLLSSASLLAGRLFLSLIFVYEGWNLIGSYGPAVAYVQKFGLSATLLPAVILLQLGGGLLVAAGLLTRLAAVTLATFCTFTAVFFHRQFADSNQLLHFQKDLAIAGGFLTTFVDGALSDDLRRHRARDQLGCACGGPFVLQGIGGVPADRHTGRRRHDRHRLGTSLYHQSGDCARIFKANSICIGPDHYTTAV